METLSDFNALDPQLTMNNSQKKGNTFLTVLIGGLVLFGTFAAGYTIGSKITEFKMQKKD